MAVGLLFSGYSSDGQNRIKGFHALRARATFVLAKVAKTASADTRRCCASVPCAPRWNRHGAELATLKHPRLYGRFQLRCSARFEGAEDQYLSNNNNSTARPSEHLRRIIFSASASASAFDSLRLGVSRASQEDGAAEAPLFERSEFGRRAPASEKRRAPERLHRSGERTAQTVLATFAKKKVARAMGAKALDLCVERFTATAE